MNPLVNPNKRGIQLPKGFKDLVDVLRDSDQKPRCEAKCEYCGAPAVVLFVMSIEDCRWCKECQQDLEKFAAIEVKVHFRTFDSNKIHDEAAISRYRAEAQRRQDDFMCQRVKERKL